MVEIKVNERESPVHVKVMKNTKGYNYEVGVRGETEDEVLKQVDSIVEKLEKKYGSVSNGQ